MAVHKEHAVVSFPSFPDIEFDDDDDYENNFIISLEDNGDEDDYPHVTPVCTSVAYTSNSTNQSGYIPKLSYQADAEKVSQIPTSSYSSDASCGNISTFSESQTTHLRNSSQSEHNTCLYSSAKESMQCSYKHSFEGGLFSYTSHYPGSHFESNMNNQKVALSSSSINGTTAISKITAADAADSHQLFSRNMSAHTAQLENRDHEYHCRKSNVAQQDLPSSYSELPKAQLETIHLDQEAGGIWTEAVFLDTTEMSDSSFSDFGTRTAQNSGLHVPVSNNSVVPKLSGPYFKTSSQHLATDGYVQTGSSVDSLSERVLKMQALNGNLSCSCVMCYKGKVNSGIQKSQKEPRLTKAEKMTIFQKPTERKKLAVSAKHSAKEVPRLQNVNFERTCPEVIAVSVNSALKTENVLSYVSKPVAASPIKTVSQMSLLDGSSSSRAIQLDLPSCSDVTAQKIIILDMNKQFISANMATGRAKTSYSQYEPSNPVTVTTNVSSAHAVIPSVPHIINISRLSSHPTKVFLKPSEVSGQTSPSVTSAVKLNSIGSLSLPGNGQTSVPSQTSCKESPIKHVSSASFGSPPNNVLYVTSDQMLFYPHQTRTPVSILQVNKQAQVKTSNGSHVAVIQLPPGNSPDKNLPTDPAFKTSHQNTLNQNYLMYLNRQNNRNSSVNAGTSKSSLQEDAENVISRPGTVILKPQQSVSIVAPAAQIHTSQVTTTAAPATTTASPVSTGYAHMRSLLKHSPPAKEVFSSAPLCISDAHSLPTESRYLTSKIQTSPDLGTPQTLASLIRPIVQDRPLANSDNKLLSLLRPGLQTSETSPENKQFSENAIPRTLHHTLLLNSVDTPEYRSPPERDKSLQTGMFSSLKKVPSPHLPEEGLPSTYIEDWVNKSSTYVSEQLEEVDCIQELSNCIPLTSSGHSDALLSSQNNPKESVPLNSAEVNNMNSAMFEMPDSVETVLSKHKAKSQLLLESPACGDSQKPNTLQAFQSDSPRTIVSSAFSVNTTGTGKMSIQQQMDHISRVRRSKEILPISSGLHTNSKKIVPAVQNIPLAKTVRRKSLTPADTPEQQLSRPLQASSAQSSSSILNSSKGIKLKIKLGPFFRNEVKHKQPADTVESTVRDTGNVSQSAEGLFLKEYVNNNTGVLGCDSGKKKQNAVSSDKIETAEEMFQRFQEQAVQEVVKAQLGMGYVSRSLRPTRTTMAFLDKYPYRFGPGKPKNNSLNEKNMCTVSEISGDSNFSKTDQMTETSGSNKQQKQLHVRNKRQVEEAADKEVKSKQSKLSIKDYPRLKQDYSISENKTVYCTNILAGHKVYVKFNTFENMSSERAFLVPFFNIGGSRTQFDVEDMEYINKAVIDFESEDRSCARHLLFYSRAGNKAVFLRKETNLQASHLNDKNYRKCSFVLEGFKRSAKRQAESSPEHWKVDNMVDIEIDRAEVDNDIETEFDANISFGEVADGPRIAAESALPSQDGHSDSIKSGAYFSRVNKPNALNTDCDLHREQAESDIISEMGRITSTVPVTSEVSGSVINSDPVFVYASHIQGSLDIQHENTDITLEQHLLCTNMCTAVKEEVLIDESDAPCTIGQMFNPAWIKKERTDVNDGENVQQLDISHPACNVSSDSSSLHSDKRGELFLDENTFIKNEPVDDYFNSLEETGPCLLGGSQMEVPHIAHLSSGTSTNLSVIPVEQEKPADHTVNFTPEEVIIPNTVAYVKIAAVHSHLTDLHDLQDHVTEPSVTASNICISRPHFVDSIVPVHIHATDAEVSSLDPLLAMTDRDNSACEIAMNKSCDINDASSVKTTSITGPSLPESPLPSSSMSYSSDILPSSDIESESDVSFYSQGAMLVTEVTSEDEDQADKQNVVHSKITSLVESLRNRLTQNTSSFPPWVASNSATETKGKKRKVVKTDVKKNLVPDNTVQKQIGCDISSSVTETCSASQTVSPLSSPVLSSVSCSIPHATGLPPSPPTGSVCLAAPSLPLHTLSSVGPSSSLTVKSTSDNLLVDVCASNDVVVKKVNSEVEVGAFSAAGTHWSDFVCAQKTDLSNEHFETACSETENPKSPVDFEIEIGNEDLPETALSLQLILPSEDLDIDALKLSRRKQREYGPDVSSPEKGNNSLINTVSCVSDYHTDKRQTSGGIEVRQKGSVASYLCKKFSFHGKSNIIKGPRLLNMPSNRKPSSIETSKQKAPTQSTLNAPTQVEPITTEELLKTPSLDEIFGASIDSELRADPENKEDPVVHCDSLISVNSNSRTKQRRIHPNTDQAHISKKKKQNRKGRESTILAQNISDSVATVFQPNSSIQSSLPNPMLHSVNKTESSSEIVPNIRACKVVLRKLELSSLDKLSENVFKLKKDSAVKERPRSHVRVTNIDSDELSESVFEIRTAAEVEELLPVRVTNKDPGGSKANISKPYKKIFKKKGRKMTRPRFKPKGDVIDYYAYMLETLQKKAQLLEEETRKKEAEECAKKMHLESLTCEEVKEPEQLTDAIEKCETVEKPEILYGQGTNNWKDETVAKPEIMNSQGTNNEKGELKNGSSKEVCKEAEVTSCILQPLEDIAVNALSTNDKDEPVLRSSVECDLSEKTENNEVANCVSQNVEASKKDHETCLQSEGLEVSNSDWPYLQKFCDEAIFNQGNIDYLQKVNKDICFPSTNEASNCELKFGEKDVVLCGSVNETAVFGELASCETFSITEDTSGCAELCIDEQEMDNMDDDGILQLGLKLKQSSDFVCDDQETRKLPFSQSPTDLHISSVDDGNIVDSNFKSRNISLDENSSSTLTVNKENTQPLSVSYQMESTDPVTVALNGNCGSSTAMNQLPTEQNVSLKNERSQRTIDVSPSWERLLGLNSVDISSRLSDETSSSHLETSQNHDVSFVASSNFKQKFKLPKGILSKAIQLSRDIKKVFENPTSGETLISNSEESPHKSLDEISKNSSNAHETCKKLTENEDCAVDIGKTHQVSQIPLSKLKFSSATLNAIQKAKAEFLQKRTSEKNCCDGLAFENGTDKLIGEQANGVHCGKENTLTHQNTDDSDKTLVVNNAIPVDSQENKELSCLGGDLRLNEGSGQLSLNTAHVDCKEVDEKVVIHAKVSVAESMSSVGDLTTDSALPSACLKERNEGIFSNLDLLQGCDADTPKPANEQASDKETPRPADENSSNKEVQADKISKINVIDIRKLKLKLNPLLGKLKGKTDNSVSGASFSSASIEKFAQTSFHKLKQKLNPHNLAKQDMTVHTSQQLGECTSVAKTTLSHSGLECVSLIGSRRQSCETDLSNVVKQNGHASEERDTNMFQSKPVSSSSEKSDNASVSTCKQLSQVNTAKLCTILKNFHKTGTTSNSLPSNQEGVLLDTSPGNKTGTALNSLPTNPKGVLLNSSPGNQDSASLQTTTQRLLRNSKSLSSAPKTVVVEADRCKTRGKRKKCDSISEKQETVTNTDMTKAKKIRQNIPTSSNVSETAQQHLLEKHNGSGEQLDGEDKGERSFFDCLPSVPLDSWE